MTDEAAPIAIIYCRVSSVKQVEEGHGLDSQETRCRDYAKRKGYEVVEVFQDKGVSGGLINRPGMQAMLGYLDSRREETPVAIIDDISRFARGIEAHWQLRAALEKAGGVLESPSIEFGSDPDSILVENLLASVSQHQREKNGEQVKNRMHARMAAGYWVSQAPMGYVYKNTKEHGKLLHRQEPLASVIQQALEGYASAKFETPAEVKRFLESQPSYPKNKHGEVHQSRVIDLFDRVLYAGYITRDGWDLHLVPAKHEALVSLETWEKVQERYHGRKEDGGNATAPIRKDTRPDFPLRGFVICCGCDKPMTAAWSKGRYARYGYYFCQRKGCSEFRKNIRKDDIEGDFETLLQQLRPSRGLLSMGLGMLKELWAVKRDRAKEAAEGFKSEIDRLERQTATVVQRLVNTTSPALITVYEDEIKRIEQSKLVLGEKNKVIAQPLASFDETYRTACQFLANPLKLWASGHIEDKRIVLRLAFAGRIQYCRNHGYRTAKTALPFKVLADIESYKSGMVPRGGIEPPTLRFSVACSTN